MPRNHSLLGPTGSLTNNIAANSRQKTPEVGMGATQLMYTDRHAGTIVELIKNNQGEVSGFIWQQDNTRRTDDNGLSESQSYEYTPNLKSPKITVTLRKNGRWVVKGEDLWSGTSFLIGHRDEYYDYSF